MIRFALMALLVVCSAPAWAQTDCEETGGDSTLEVVDEACKVVQCEEGKFLTIDSKETLARAVAAYEGQPVVFFVFGTWCGICRHELEKELPALYEKYSAKGVRFVGVAVGQRSESGLQEFVDELEIDFTVWRDPAMTTARAVGAFGVPHTVFIGADGKVVYERIGPYAKDDIAVIDALENISASKATAAK